MSNPSIEMDEALNAIDYLKKTVRFLREVEAGELIAWKRVCISAHGALYAFHPERMELFVDGLRHIVSSVLGVVNFLALETGTYLEIRIDETQQGHIAALTKEGRDICARLHVKYGAA